MSVGGSIRAISLGGRNFSVAADAEAQRKLGGFENEVQSNGDGSARVIKTVMPLLIEGLTLNTNDDRGDQEYLQGIADANDFAVLGVTFASGSVYQGSAIITGELNFSSQNSTTSVSLSGPGKLTKQ